jgi:RNA polymerase sigma factor (sigma-70 family)
VQATNITPHELDHRLSLAAAHLDSYDRVVGELIDELDGSTRDLVLEDPLTWRGGGPDNERRVPRSLEEQFRTEVDAIRTLDREAEARLARRIEFARRRLERALARHGIDPEEIARGGAHRHPSQEVRAEHDEPLCQYPEDLCRRWLELHWLRTEMVERNLYLVLINVERYSHTRASRMDLVQEGSAALFRAVDGFDWRRGLLFRTYAVHWLNQAFRAYLYNFGNTVRVPVYLQKAMKHVHDAVERLGNPNALPEEIAEVAGLGVNLVESALDASRNTHSIDAQFGSDDDSSSLRELIGFEEKDPYDPRMEEVSLKEGIEMALERLSEREKLVIERRFGIGGQGEHTLAQIAEELGVSLERVRQIQVRAISKMNTPTVRKAIDPFLL